MHIRVATLAGLLALPLVAPSAASADGHSRRTPRSGWP
jgi:hypothetical protein